MIYFRLEKWRFGEADQPVRVSNPWFPVAFPLAIAPPDRVLDSGAFLLV